MKIRELKEILRKYPEDMAINLIDLGTDDFYSGNYHLEASMIQEMDAVKEEGDMNTFKSLFIVFNNKRAPDIMSMSSEEYHEYSQLEKQLEDWI